MGKYYIKTFGCKLNQTDSCSYQEVLDRFLDRSSFKEADLILINSCGVVEKTEKRVIKSVRECKREGKYVILTGCLPAILREEKRMIADKIISGRDFDGLEAVLKRNFKERKFENKMEGATAFQEVSAIVPLSWGCLGNCTYCMARIARGTLKSRSQQEVIEEVDSFLDSGFKEIQLTSQDIAVYGMDRGQQELPELLEKLIKRRGDFRLRIGMGNPGYMKKIIPDLFPLFKSEKIYNYLHVPVQSGSNKILSRMKRGHSTKDFEDIARAFYNEFKEPLLATDIIIGFPGETEEDFSKSCALIEKAKPHIVNITRFSSREGTSASKMESVSPGVIAARSKKINEMTRKIRIEQNKKMIGKKENVLIAQKGKKDTFIARFPNYRALIVKEGTLGCFKRAEVTGYKHNYLEGRIISDCK